MSYVAKVLEDLGDNLYHVEIRNKLSLGDLLDVTVPGEIELHEFKIEELYDSPNRKNKKTC